jgi:hypothetical protein
MKQIFSIPIGGTSLTDPATEVGMERWADGKRYRFVKNSSGGALAVGDCVCYGVTGDATVKNEVFKLGQSSKGTTVSFFAGCSQDVVPDGAYFWLQTGGPGTAKIYDAGASVIIGDYLVPVSGQFYASLHVATAADIKHPRLMIATAAYTAAATATTMLVVINGG